MNWWTSARGGNILSRINDNWYIYIYMAHNNNFIIITLFNYRWEKKREFIYFGKSHPQLKMTPTTDSANIKSHRIDLYSTCFVCFFFIFWKNIGSLTSNIISDLRIEITHHRHLNNRIRRLSYCLLLLFILFK